MALSESLRRILVGELFESNEGKILCLPLRSRQACGFESIGNGETENNTARCCRKNSNKYRYGSGEFVLKFGLLHTRKSRGGIEELKTWIIDHYLRP